MLTLHTHKNSHMYLVTGFPLTNRKTSCHLQFGAPTELTLQGQLESLETRSIKNNKFKFR